MSISGTNVVAVEEFKCVFIVLIISANSNSSYSQPQRWFLPFSRRSLPQDLYSLLCPEKTLVFSDRRSRFIGSQDDRTWGAMAGNHVWNRYVAPGDRLTYLPIPLSKNLHPVRICQLALPITISTHAPEHSEHSNPALRV